MELAMGDSLSQGVQISDRGDTPATMARALGALFLAGAATGALTLLLPHDHRANDAALWSNVALAAVTAIGLIALAPRIKPWMLAAIVAAGTLTVTRAVYYSHDPGTFYGLWYVWVGLFS